MHPLEEIINNAEGFLLFGDSSDDRFPAFSYNAYTKTETKFFCIDMGGRTVSRGPTSDGKVYISIDELPAERGDLAVIWVKPKRAAEAVQLAVEAGCTRVWFSFATGHRDAVKAARDAGMEVVEIGRCPVYYLKHDAKPGPCKMHTAMTKISGSYKRPPQTDPDEKRREMW